MSEFIYLLVKRGSQAGWGGVKDGGVICYIDPNDWPGGLPVFSAFQRKCAVVCRVPRSWLSYVKPMCLPSGEFTGAETKAKTDGYRATGGIVDFVDLERLSSVSGLIENIRSWKSLDVVNIGGCEPTEVIRPSSIYPRPEVSDVFATTVGIKTVGSGGDFATWSAAGSDLAALTGNVEFRQVSSITETGNGGFGVNVGAHQLKFVGGAFSGDFLGSYITTKNSAAGTTFGFAAGFAGSGRVIFKNLALRGGADVVSGTGFYPSGGTFTGNFDFQNCLLDGNGKAYYGLYLATGSPIYRVWNCIFTGFSVTNGYPIGIAAAMTGGYLCENSVIGGSYFGCNNNSNVTGWVNCVWNGCTTNFNLGTNSTTDYCGTNKASVGGGTNTHSVVNFVAADTFQSTSVASARFYRLKKGGVLNDSGTVPTITDNIRGIVRNERPHKILGGRAYSIGADEWKKRTCEYNFVQRIR